MTLKFQRLEIPDVILIEPQVREDPRGFFMETYKASEWRAFGINAEFVQDNHSRSIGPILRGLHFQKPPHAAGKLVRVIEGEIFDVAVDVRKGSPTYGKWVGERLSDTNHRMLYVPEGFAHGFCALSEIAEVLYKMTAEYAPRHEVGLLWNDSDIGIDWPIQNPILSPRDAANRPLKEIDSDFVFEEMKAL